MRELNFLKRTSYLNTYVVKIDIYRDLIKCLKNNIKDETISKIFTDFTDFKSKIINSNRTIIKKIFYMIYFVPNRYFYFKNIVTFSLKRANYIKKYIQNMNDKKINNLKYIYCIGPYINYVDGILVNH
jgi:hypothetical protein